MRMTHKDDAFADDREARPLRQAAAYYRAGPAGQALQRYLGALGGMRQTHAPQHPAVGIDFDERDGDRRGAAHHLVVETRGPAEARRDKRHTGGDLPAIAEAQPHGASAGQGLRFDRQRPFIVAMDGGRCGVQSREAHLVYARAIYFYAFAARAQFCRFEDLDAEPAAWYLRA